MDNARAPVSVIVLAGGRGKRRATRRSSRLQRRNAATAERDLVEPRATTSSLCASRAATRGTGARVITDRAPFGLWRAFSPGRGRPQEWALVVACDMPFLSIPLLRYLLTLRPGYDGWCRSWRYGAASRPVPLAGSARACAALERERRLISFYRASAYALSRTS